MRSKQRINKHAWVTKPFSSLKWEALLFVSEAGQVQQAHTHCSITHTLINAGRKLSKRPKTFE